MSVKHELDCLEDRLAWVARNLDEAMKYYQQKDYSMANSFVCTASSVLDQAIKDHFKESK